VDTEHFQPDSLNLLPLDYGQPSSKFMGEQRGGDALFTFDGLNVEDLWNWMLVTDTTDPNDDIEWINPSVARDNGETI